MADIRIHELGPNDRLVIALDLDGAEPTALAKPGAIVVVDSADIDVFIVRNGRNQQEDSRNG